VKILHLTLKKKWFDMIASGEKKEEYREIKGYWEKRLYYNTSKGQPKEWDVIRFRNGYSKQCPIMDVEWKGTWLDEGRPEWGAESGEKYFVILIGKIISITHQ
jgi:hypothetical protein